MGHILLASKMDIMHKFILIYHRIIDLFYNVLLPIATVVLFCVWIFMLFHVFGHY
jgi:hypothetical protein